jgi:tRNA nucleotidyltransferase/poly(A) polymerase
MFLYGKMESMRNKDLNDIMRFVPDDVKGVMKRLHESGFDVWLVGGALRDFIMGRTPKDWDLATVAAPSKVMELFLHVAPIGIRHGTVQVLTGQRGVEVTSTPGGGREGILADLGRRDFTVNALAVAYGTGELLDPFGGERDLRDLRLRTAGDARSRFREDPLRTLRAGRLISTHGFTIERTTFDAIEKEAGGLDWVAPERIRDEVFKMLLGVGIIKGFDSMRDAGVLSRVLPELLEGCGKELDREHSLDIYQHSLYTAHHCPPRIRVRLAALFHAMGKPRMWRLSDGELRYPDYSQASVSIASEIMMRWCMSKREMREIAVLVANHLRPGAEGWSGAAIRRLIVRTGTDLLEDLLDLAMADRLSMMSDQTSVEKMRELRSRVHEELGHGLPMRIADLAVDGADVMREAGLKPGPAVGRILGHLHQRVIESPELNERKILLDFLKKGLHKENVMTPHGMERRTSPTQDDDQEDSKCW